MHTKIVLLGYMGSGKTTIGHRLANELKLPFWDLDEVIGQMFGMSVQYMITRKGELYFRECEQKALKVVIANQAYILATGGGTPCYYNNLEVIKNSSTSIYLQCNPGTLAERLVPEKQNRPLIADIEDDFMTEFIAKHLFERNPYYQQAHYTIDANNSPDIVLEDVLSALDVKKVE